MKKPRSAFAAACLCSSCGPGIGWMSMNQPQQQLSHASSSSFEPKVPADTNPSELSHSKSMASSVATLWLALIVSTTSPLPIPASAATTITNQSWTLGNGNVELPIPLTLGSLNLRDPVLLGSGGGGAVFAMTPTNNHRNKVAVKISWESSAQSVANECRILQILQANQVSGVEQCLASAAYSSEGRIMIAMQPVVEDSVVNSISELHNPQLELHAVQQVVRTLVQMLNANVVTTDVQFLLANTTGQVLFIDFTDAQVLSQPPTFLQLALCNSFVAEMMALIPQNMEGVASHAMDQELKQLGVGTLQPQVREILREQVRFLSSQSIQLLGG